jgi:hypothetical protein
MQIVFFAIAGPSVRARNSRRVCYQLDIIVGRAVNVLRGRKGSSVMDVDFRSTGTSRNCEWAGSRAQKLSCQIASSA